MKNNLRKYFFGWSTLILCGVLLMLSQCSRESDLEKGISALERGDYLNAVKTLNASLLQDSLNPEIHYNLSLAYVNLDSIQKAQFHFLNLVALGSPLKESVRLKELLASALGMEPYPSTPIPMKRMHQFKGAFSPTADTLVIAAASSHRPDIYLISRDGSVIKRITNSFSNTDPDYSPDGKTIVFVSTRDGDEELFLYDIISEEITRLTTNTASDFFPSYAPNGKDIVFVSNRDNPYRWEIYKIGIESKRVKKLTTNDFWDGFPRFTSDMRAVVFSSKHEHNENIYTIKTGGGGEKILYQNTADNNDPTIVGDHLYFKSNIDGNWEIYRMNLKTKKVVRLTYNNRPDWNPRISGDGRKMVYSQ
ncbi:MAG: PD40 domain-containing protein, partial [candidate division WOR-3 bacterium]